MANGPRQELVRGGPARAPGARALLLLVAAGIGLRVLLVFLGRFCLDDGFYLQNAWRLGQGERPFEDFVHVAFPLVEWLYAPFLALAEDRLTAASLVTGGAVVATAVLLARLLGPACGAGAGLAAGLLYMVAAPIFAFHQFEREIWTNLGLAAAALALLRADAENDRRALTGGLLLGLTLACKLTAAVGAGALLLELLLQRRTRAALLAAGSALFLVAAATLLLTARYDGEFLSQAFLFYFFKERAPGRAQVGAAPAGGLARSLPPALALVLGPQRPGSAAAGKPRGRLPRRPPDRPAAAAPGPGRPARARGRGARHGQPAPGLVPPRLRRRRPDPRPRPGGAARRAERGIRPRALPHAGHRARCGPALLPRRGRARAAGARPPQRSARKGLARRLAPAPRGSGPRRRARDASAAAGGQPLLGAGHGQHAAARPAARRGRDPRARDRAPARASTRRAQARALRGRVHGGAARRGRRPALPARALAAARRAARATPSP
ncbi:MAG: glycosyltransferase family 39 protein [Planctomycetes bacterium]|nr:glycosyltransferase family 39 protein [Planctomycetota bacterium]